MKEETFTTLCEERTEWDKMHNFGFKGKWERTFVEFGDHFSNFETFA